MRLFRMKEHGPSCHGRDLDITRTISIYCDNIVPSWSPGVRLDPACMRACMGEGESLGWGPCTVEQTKHVITLPPSAPSLSLASMTTSSDSFSSSPPPSQTNSTYKTSTPTPINKSSRVRRGSNRASGDGPTDWNRSYARTRNRNRSPGIIWSCILRKSFRKC